MKNLVEAKKSLARVTFTEDQRQRSQKAWSACADLLEVFFQTAQPSAELTLACRAIEEACMWHSKAISNESK
jgi:hypothetical protein